MSKVEHHFEYMVYNAASDAPKPYRELLESAQSILSNAYAPYSGFRVGAAVRMSDGSIITGNNQENASFPEGLCAERVALFSAGATHPLAAALAIAIVTDPKSALPASPCGGCRQVMVETEYRSGKPMEVVLTDKSGKVYVFDSARDLLPFGFDGGFLIQPGRP